VNIPGQPVAHPNAYLHALASYRAGRLRDALQACVGHLQSTHTPYPATLALLGRVLADSGHYPEALRELTRALDLDATDTSAWLSLALVNVRLKHWQSVQECVLKALSNSPLDAEVNAVSAGLLLEIDDYPGAHEAAQRASILAPTFAPGWFNLALALQADGSLAAALDAARRARSLDPGNPAASGLVAELEADAGDLAAARVTLADALLRHPDNPALLMQSAWAAQRAGDLHAATDTYTRLLALQPHNGAAVSQLIFCHKQLLDWSGLDGFQQRFRQEVAAGTPLLTPFSFLSDPSTRAEQRQCAKTWGEGFIPDEALRPAPPAAETPTETPARRLRIGYLSGDFYEHPTAVLLAGVLERHDRARFEVFAYSTGPDDASPMRARVIAACEHFTDLRERRAETIAARIAADHLDVLVDLKGYTEGAPTAALALRPAPVQAHWVGYPATLAAPFIDYLLVDRIVAPPQHAADYAEALVWLPDACQPNDRSRIAATPPSRQSVGLGDTDVVLASFNAAWKSNPPVFDAWARVLAATPRSVLWLMARHGADPAIANARREMANRGIASERIVFATRRTQPAYLALYLHADLFLDTWPYNAHTTASDALWMGCPMVTWLGDTFAGRVGASLVSAAGLGELATDSVAAYIELAVALASDAARRASLRVRLAEARTHSPLFDADAMARHVERAYATMVEQHRSGVVASFEVPRG